MKVAMLEAEVGLPVLPLSIFHRSTPVQKVMAERCVNRLAPRLKFLKYEET